MLNLDLSILNHNLESDFSKIAEMLMLESALDTKKTKYHFAEIEFYLFHKELHPDNSTHCNSRQLTKVNWYIHRYKNSEIYKQGKRQGIVKCFIKFK